MSSYRTKVSFTSRFPIHHPGGIESSLRELFPRIAAAHAWAVSTHYAFRQATYVNRIPFFGDLIAGCILAVKTWDDDVAVVNGAEYAWLRILIPRLRRRTIVVWHGTRAGEIPALVPHPSVLIKIYLWLEIALQSLSLRAPIQIAVSPSTVDEIRATYPSVQNVRVILNGAPAASPNQLLRIPNESPIILWMGTNSFKKGLDTAIEACDLARAKTGLNIKLRVAGISSPRNELDFVEYLGSINHDRVRAEFGTANVFLATTRYEACSIAILEAMTFEIPIVASPIVGWMLGTHASVARTYASDAFAELLIDVLSHMERAKRDAVRIRDELERFDWDAAAKQYSDLIAELVDESSGCLGEHLRQTG